MKSTNYNYSIDEFATQIEIVSKLDAIIDRLIKGMKDLMKRMEQKRAEVRLQSYYQKRQSSMRGQQDASHVPMENSLKSAFYRDFGNYRN